MRLLYAAQEALRHALETDVRAQWVSDLKDELDELDGKVLQAHDRSEAFQVILKQAKEMMITDGVNHVLPLSLKSFSEAHDHVDANDYLLAAGEFDDSAEEHIPCELYNQVSHMLDMWIKQGQYEVEVLYKTLKPITEETK